MMPKYLKYVFWLALIIFASSISSVISQVVEPGVQQIVNALGGQLPGQSTASMKGSLVQCRGQNTEATVGTNATNLDIACDLFGRVIHVPYTSADKWIRGIATATTTGAVTFSNFTAVASVKNYVTSIQCYRTDAGTTMVFVTLNDSASTTVPVPPGSGASIPYGIPLATAANTALTFNESAATNAITCSAQGYQGA